MIICNRLFLMAAILLTMVEGNALAAQLCQAQLIIFRSGVVASFANADITVDQKPFRIHLNKVTKIDVGAGPHMIGSSGGELNVYLAPKTKRFIVLGIRPGKRSGFLPELIDESYARLNVKEEGAEIGTVNCQ